MSKPNLRFTSKKSLNSWRSVNTGGDGRGGPKSGTLSSEKIFSLRREHFRVICFLRPSPVFWPHVCLAAPVRCWECPLGRTCCPGGPGAAGTTQLSRVLQGRGQVFPHPSRSNPLPWAGPGTPGITAKAATGHLPSQAAHSVL